MTVAAKSAEKRVIAPAEIAVENKTTEIMDKLEGRTGKPEETLRLSFAASGLNFTRNTLLRGFAEVHGLDEVFVNEMASKLGMSGAINVIEKNTKVDANGNVITDLDAILDKDAELKWRHELFQAARKMQENGRLEQVLNGINELIHGSLADTVANHEDIDTAMLVLVTDFVAWCGPRGVDAEEAIRQSFDNLNANMSAYAGKTGGIGGHKRDTIKQLNSQFGSKAFENQTAKVMHNQVVAQGAPVDHKVAEQMAPKSISPVRSHDDLMKELIDSLGDPNKSAQVRRPDVDSVLSVQARLTLEPDSTISKVKPGEAAEKKLEPVRTEDDLMAALKEAAKEFRLEIKVPEPRKLERVPTGPKVNLASMIGDVERPPIPKPIIDEGVVDEEVTVTSITKPVEVSRKRPSIPEPIRDEEDEPILEKEVELATRKEPYSIERAAAPVKETKAGDYGAELSKKLVDTLNLNSTEAQDVQDALQILKNIDQNTENGPALLQSVMNLRNSGVQYGALLWVKSFKPTKEDYDDVSNTLSNLPGR